MSYQSAAIIEHRGYSSPNIVILQPANRSAVSQRTFHRLVNVHLTEMTRANCDDIKSHLLHRIDGKVDLM